MPKLRVITAFMLITISLVAFGVDFFAVGEPAGTGVTDHLVTTGFESP